MDIEDKRYWVEEAIGEIGALSERVTTDRELEELTSMQAALSEILDDLVRLEYLEK